jgi:hypothetical protein
MVSTSVGAILLPYIPKIKNREQIYGVCICTACPQKETERAGHSDYIHYYLFENNNKFLGCGSRQGRGGGKEMIDNISLHSATLPNCAPHPSPPFTGAPSLLRRLIVKEARTITD